MTGRPHDTVATALIDAVASGPILGSGGVDRSAVECAAALSSIADNLAADTYHKRTGAVVPRDGARLSAFEEGRRILAVEGVTWLIDHGYFRVLESGGLALARVYTLSSGESYTPWTGREEGLFRSMRRVIPKRLDLLRESVERLPGLKHYFPVLLDNEGNVVDGRHRRALDPNWPAAAQRVLDEDRVAAAVAANRSNAWTSADWERLREHVEAVYGKQKAGRELARLALLENHERDNTEVAHLVGCSDETVRSVRLELENSQSLGIFRGKRGRKKGSKDAQPRKSRKQDKPQVDELAASVIPGSEPAPDEAPVSQPAPEEALAASPVTEPKPETRPPAVPVTPDLRFALAGADALYDEWRSTPGAISAIALRILARAEQDGIALPIGRQA